MPIEVGAQLVPMRWTTQSGREISKGLSLTQFAALDDGIYELIRMRRWCEKRDFWFTKVLTAALAQEHLKAAVQDATIKLDRAGARRGKAKAAGKAVERELAARREDCGLFS